MTFNKGLRFDEDFVRAHQKKHGRSQGRTKPSDFDTNVLTTKQTRSKANQRDQLNDKNEFVWLACCQNHNDRLTTSAHHKALKKAIKNPKLIEGNQEHFEQVIIFAFLEQFHIDVYKHLYAVPNGGYRTPKWGEIMRSEGVKAGTLDIAMDLPAGIYHGFKLELKASCGQPKVSEKQKEKLAELTNNGYRACLAVGYKEAIAQILQYYYLYESTGFDNQTALPELDGKFRPITISDTS